MAKKRSWVIQKQTVVEGEGGKDIPVWEDVPMPTELQEKINAGKMTADIGERWILRQKLGERYRLAQISIEGTVADVPEPRRRLS